MNVCDTSLEKPLQHKESTYFIRNAYRQAMQQFMAGKERTSSLVHPADLDHYLRYEKQLSLHLQERLSDAELHDEHASSVDSSLDL